MRASLDKLIEYRLTYMLMYRRSPKWGIYSFLQHCIPDGELLDVGCGFDSPRRIQQMIPKAIYTGIDIHPENEYLDRSTQRYIYCANPRLWAQTIQQMPHMFDTIVCNHNLEHCQQPQEALEAMSERLKKGGYMYIAVPSSRSVAFPSRRGTLNYYDDWTHITAPPTIAKIITSLEEANMNILVTKECYRPTLAWLCGMLQEPFSRAAGRVYPGTWAYWGFESVIWATKK